MPSTIDDVLASPAYASVFTQDDANKLKDYFNSDPRLKNSPELQRSILEQVFQRSLRSGEAGDVVQAAKDVNWQTLSPAQRQKFYPQTASVQSAAPVTSSAANDSLYQPQPPINPASTISEAQWSELSQTLGYDAKAAFTRYSQNYGRAVPSRLRDSGGDMSPPDPGEWMDQQKQAIYGQWTPAVDLFSSGFEAQYGQQMPGELQRQIRDAMAKAPYEAQQQVTGEIQALDDLQNTARQLQQALGMAKQITANKNSYPTPQAYQAALQPWADILSANGLTANSTETDLQSAIGTISKSASGITKTLSGIPWINDLIDKYSQAHQLGQYSQANAQAALAGKALGSRQGAYYQVANSLNLPGSMSWDQIQKMTDTEFNDWLNNVNMPGTGLTWGRYNAVSSRVNNLWSRYFNATPSQNDIAHAATMSPEDYGQWVTNQPSHQKGLNIGQAEGLASTANQITNQLWGTNADSDMIHTLAQATGQK